MSCLKWNESVDDLVYVTYDEKYCEWCFGELYGDQNF